LPAAKINAKRGPKTALDDDALLALIRADIKDSPFTGEGHRKVHARLHFLAGHKVGRNRVLRLMRVHNLLSPHRAAFVPAKAHDGRIITDAPNVRWATDGAKIWTGEDGWVWLFDLVEHWNGECLGWHVCKIGDRFAAWEPLAQAIATTLGGIPNAARGIELRHATAPNTSPTTSNLTPASTALPPASPCSANRKPTASSSASTALSRNKSSTAAPTNTSPNSAPPSPPSSTPTTTTGASKNSATNPPLKPGLPFIPPCL
jgi:hypothetical protein